MQSFGKYETGHNLEFYGQWRHIMSEINPRKMAEYALLYGQQLWVANCTRNILRIETKRKIPFRTFLCSKSLIENLRTSTNRCDQLSVLAVLLLYTEQLSPEKLSQLKENSNIYILDKLPALNKHPHLLTVSKVRNYQQTKVESSSERIKLIASSICVSYCSGESHLWFNERDIPFEPLITVNSVLVSGHLLHQSENTIFT